MSSELYTLPVALPNNEIPRDVEPSTIALEFRDNFNGITEDCFFDNAVWRDTFALTGSQRTFYSARTISQVWSDTAPQRQVQSLLIDPYSAETLRLPNGSAFVNVRFSFETKGEPAAFNAGIMALAPDAQGVYRIWSFRTIIQRLAGQKGPDSLRIKSQRNMPNDAPESDNFDCVVVGGGPSGLSMGGRLHALGMKYVIIDSLKEVGDNWKTRYSSAKLHTVRQYAQLPFERTFNSSHQEYLTKDELAEGYRLWAERFGVHIWQSTTMTAGRWSPKTNSWKLEVTRHGERQVINARHVVLCTGFGGQIPWMPEYADREGYQGKIVHSAHYTDSKQWAGKKGIVIGTANTAHDIADDMYEAGMTEVTMVQRSPTYILPVEYVKKGTSPIYNEHTPMELADMIYLTGPLVVSSLISRASLNFMASQQPERFDALERAGFKCKRYGDVVSHVFEKAGGHYIDTGVSQKISDGKIKMKSNALPVRWTETGLLFDDGEHIEADVVTFATGFEKNGKNQIEQWFGEEVASQVSDFGGLTEDGDLRGACKPTGHPAMWYLGIALGPARYYSRFIAMQIQADLLGTPLPEYKQKFPIARYADPVRSVHSAAPHQKQPQDFPAIKGGSAPIKNGSAPIKNGSTTAGLTNGTTGLTNGTTGLVGSYPDNLDA